MLHEIDARFNKENEWNHMNGYVNAAIRGYKLTQRVKGRIGSADFSSKIIGCERLSTQIRPRTEDTSILSREWTQKMAGSTRLDSRSETESDVSSGRDEKGSMASDLQAALRKYSQKDDLRAVLASFVKKQEEATNITLATGRDTESTDATWSLPTNTAISV
jgi:hypothetical protein